MLRSICNEKESRAFIAVMSVEKVRDVRTSQGWWASAEQPFDPDTLLQEAKISYLPRSLIVGCMF